jgi:hypothetical protein
MRNHPRIHRPISVRIAAIKAYLASFETIKTFAIAAAPLTPESGLLRASLKVKRGMVFAAHGDVLEALHTKRQNHDTASSSLALALSRAWSITRTTTTFSKVNDRGS